MTRSTRNETQPKTARADRNLQDLSERTISAANPVGESGAALETLSIRHPALRIECWPGANVMESAAVTENLRLCDSQRSAYDGRRGDVRRYIA